MTRISDLTRDRARHLRREMTPQERKLWPRLRELNRMLGTHFRRQAPIGPSIADFADLGRKLVIELDGGGHGGAPDMRRDDWFAAQGYLVLRFWNLEMAENPDGVMDRILDALNVAPPPHPSPTRGEGGAMSDRARGVDNPGASPPPGGEGLGVGGPRNEGREK